MGTRLIELDYDQCCSLLVEMLEELEESMIDASCNLANGQSSLVFSTDDAEEKKQIRKMLKAVKRVKSWYAA
jgi:hypothetical protein